MATKNKSNMNAPDALFIVSDLLVYKGVYHLFLPGHAFTNKWIPVSFTKMSPLNCCLILFSSYDVFINSHRW